MKSEGVYTPQHHPSVDNKSKPPMLIYTVKNISKDAVISLMFNTIYGIQEINKQNIFGNGI